MTEKTLYEMDERLWLFKQIDALKSNRMDDLDVDTLAEHLQCLVRVQHHEIWAAFMGIAWRLLWLEFVDLDANETIKLRHEIMSDRHCAERHLEDTPSIRDYVETRMPEIWADALQIAGMQGPFSPPAKCYTFEQLIDHAWFPTLFNRPNQP